jgi:uncharacterized protein YndB with AHSA1/START domain
VVFFKGRSQDGNDVRLRGEVRDVEQPLQLLQADGDGRAGHEANDHRMRKKLLNEPEPVHRTKTKSSLEKNLTLHRGGTQKRQQEVVMEEVGTLPEEAEASLENAREEGRGERKMQVKRRLLRRVHLSLQQRPQQKRHHRHRTDGDVPRTPQHRVHQRRHKTRICHQKQTSPHPQTQNREEDEEGNKSK